MCFFGTICFGSIFRRISKLGERFGWDILGAYSVDSVEFFGWMLCFPVELAHCLMGFFWWNRLVCFRLVHILRGLTFQGPKV